MSRDPDAVLDRWRRETRDALPAAGDDLVEEVAQHCAARWQQARDAGLSAAEADARVARDLEAWRARDRARSRLSVIWSGWSVEARHALRALRLRPMFAAGMIALTAIAVAANVAAFAVAYGLRWRPLPYPDGDRLAVLWEFSRGETTQISLPDFRDLTGGGLFEAASAVGGGRGSLRVGDRIERVNVLALEPQGFAMLGARPVAGRLLGPADAGKRVVLISHRLWRGQLGADPNIVGRTLWLSGNTYEVAGVLAPGFDFELSVGRAFMLENHDVWTLIDPADPVGARRDVSGFEALVRLRPGMTAADAQHAVDDIASRLAREHAATNRDRGFRVAPLRGEVVGKFDRPLALAGLAAVLTLAIALANLATLAGVRLSERQHELAVRRALGAGEVRLRRQLITEYAAVVATGAAAGLVAAKWLVSSLAANDAAHLPYVDSIRFDAPVWAVALGLVLTIIVVLALLPMRAGNRTNALRTGGRASSGGRRTRRVLVAAELALALALASGGALIGLSLERLMAVDPGFAERGVVSARVSAYAARYPGLPEVETFFGTVIDRLSALPGLDRVGAGSGLPLSGQSTGTGVVVEGQSADPAARKVAGWQFVTPGYFEALGMTLRNGRLFSADDRAHDGHVSIVNEALARELFGDGNPIGRRIATGDGDKSGDWHEIVGVVADVRYSALASPPQPRLYDLFGEHWGRTLFVVARARMADESSMLAPMRRAIAAIDPEAPVFESAAMADLVARSAAPYRLSAAMAAGLALAALVLALAGVYAIAAVSVAERAREAGVRAALGASPRDLLRLILGEGIWTAVIGGFAGCLCAWGVATVVRAQLFGVTTADVAAVIPLAAIALMTSAVAATLPPARRAAGADPLIAMRTE
ncbi:MAG TPA: ADOP family duplicated permease [Vicinamibacterales bacterium]|nr:ADOP family duplicated permease [Vicinamibacterales bacterium]